MSAPNAQPVISVEPEIPVTMTVLPLPDPVVEQAGFAVASPYVEAVWLAVLGPSATWALRRLGTMATVCPDGVRVELAQFAASIGLGSSTGRNVVRTLRRLVAFGMAEWRGDAFLVRRAVGPLPERQLRRVDSVVVERHRRLVASRQERGLGG